MMRLASASPHRPVPLKQQVQTSVNCPGVFAQVLTAYVAER